MKNILLICLVICSFKSWGQDVKFKNFNSELMGIDRGVKIYIPPSYYIDSTKQYPLAIVLDGEFLFDIYVGNSILFAKKENAPEQIVVGINQNQYNERYEDCSYSEENSFPTSEGDAFYNFIKLELLSYFDENYRTSPFKTIVGNTLTANFINYFLVDDYAVFNAYININPYYAMDVPYMLDQKVLELNNESVYYYLSNGNYNIEKRQTIINDTDVLLKEVTNPKFKYQFDNFTNSTKTASIGQSISSAMAFVFDLYSAISKEEFENEIKDLHPADAIAYLENKYVEIEYLFGSNLKIRERDIYAIESIILDKENGDYLRNFGEMINKLYKESPIGDYYIGKYYETEGKFKMALRYYKEGYMKLPEGDPNADGYFENVERVLSKRAGNYIEPETKN